MLISSFDLLVILFTEDSVLDFSLPLYHKFLQSMKEMLAFIWMTYLEPILFLDCLKLEILDYTPNSTSVSHSCGHTLSFMIIWYCSTLEILIQVPHSWTRDATGSFFVFHWVTSTSLVLLSQWRTPFSWSLYLYQLVSLPLPISFYFSLLTYISKAWIYSQIYTQFPFYIVLLLSIGQNLNLDQSLF